ncbi:MAG TPA: class I SAM-dependent methyltransferase [Rhizomicrobium sp.]|nr:class I SAM-dependent methyltransferase [Rhizomicrobium sp.]
MSTQRHWDDAYRAKPDGQVSWFQQIPSRSLALIEAAGLAKDAPILDVGGGASRLMDALLAKGYSDLSVLDVSVAALARSQERLGAKAAKISWITADVTTWKPERQWMVWHDRAMFHFLVEEYAQWAYVSALRRATAPGATVLIAGFAPDGPQRCSGLPVWRHSAEGLARCLGKKFTLAGEAHETHRTPAGANQNFLYVSFRRRS